MRKLWNSCVKNWQVTVSILGGLWYAVIWVGNVSGHEARITTVEERITRIDYNVQNIANKMGVETLKRE